MLAKIAYDLGITTEELWALLNSDPYFMLEEE